MIPGIFKYFPGNPGPELGDPGKNSGYGKVKVLPKKGAPMLRLAAGTYCSQNWIVDSLI